ncbi:mandelate racemase/muconate lactonizing enzyme family protein [Tabrizicola sp.]|uniref:mandelate racemase/muconate lactonizing enzyme family protein n=1 Tax=Tabrizicola sp. TaxID=2005166 RepID=UPI002631BA3C|nr:mandelate racemase/muconate lactonizing enzyme family protein [Tabrizicola sp.]MDM7931524.1 mandelate racemase/muconate lactonizing enzyme family protein [Tabrizicola sp.]
MQPLADLPLVLSQSNLQARAGLPEFTLAQVETWITAPAEGGEGWGEVKPCLLVRVTTNAGIAGWGEAFVLPCREKAVAEIIHALGQASVSLQPAWPWVFRDMALRIASKHRGLDFSAASSALEMALWDIYGKLAEEPLCKVLGGHTRRAVPVYANIWSDMQWDATSLAMRASGLVAAGYTAVKVHPMLNHSVTEAVQAVARVRAAIGDEIHLMVDLDTQDDPETSLSVAERIASVRPYWFEEPVDGQDIEGLARIRKTTGMRIVTGEKHCGLPHFRAVLTAGAADILNPDIAGLGGLLDMIEVAELANRQGVKVSPHCWNSMTVAAAAMLHVCAAIPNAEMAEIYPEYVEHGARYATTGFRLDGAHAHLSGRPGLGVDIDTNALRDLSRHFRSSRLTTARATR